MIDKNFYLENLSAFDILIQDDREKAEKVIFRVFSILQRDKIWLSDVATAEEIFEEDAELLQEVEAELQELDEQYDFHFDDFYKRVQLEMKKMQSSASQSFSEEDLRTEDNDLQHDDFAWEEDEDADDEGFLEDDDFLDGDNFQDADLDEEDDDDEDYSDDDDEMLELSHISDEELDLITDTILESAKTRFDYAAFLNAFPQLHEALVEEQLLFPVIAGKAHGESDLEIAESIQSALMSHGFSPLIQELIKMSEQKGAVLGLEILAFGVAADALQQGADPTMVLHQIIELLDK